MYQPMQITSAAVCRPSRIDREASLRRLGGDEELFADVVGFFKEDAPALMQAIRDGVRRDDAEQLARAAHSLKGLAANLGDQSLTDAAQEVERAAQSRNLDLAKRLSRTVGIELTKTLRELEGAH